ncbi:MAG: histidinol dehydrogenase, partial [Deltaproteobacteria bacterium]|nr:histidinol dehydrogenase [Deltaproteobacteria bacterium]
SDVRARGDAAVREYTERFEKRHLGDLEVTRARWEQEAGRVSSRVSLALERAAARIRAFHERQRESGYRLEEPGLSMQLRVEPLATVGLYVPGGTARYPSSVLMTAIPARVAGVRELIMVTPGASPETLEAARIAGVDRVFEIGGAQAIAALAHGTESVPRVDKIVGPGNIYVAAAKRLVFGDVDIDSVAGPSEVLIIADHTAEPVHVAADLLAQAEHDVEACAVLLSTSEDIARRAIDEVIRQLDRLPRREVAAEALKRHGRVVVVSDLGAAIRLANRVAPEHLELHVEDAARVAENVRTAGAIFVGPFTPEAAGDYLAGPNHVLPTGGAARYGSPLGVYDFLKRTTVLEYTRDVLAAHAEDILCLAGVEGLDAHGRSVSIRLIDNDEKSA